MTRELELGSFVRAIEFAAGLPILGRYDARRSCDATRGWAALTPQGRRTGVEGVARPDARKDPQPCTKSDDWPADGNLRGWSPRLPQRESEHACPPSLAH